MFPENISFYSIFISAGGFTENVKKKNGASIWRHVLLTYGFMPYSNVSWGKQKIFSVLDKNISYCVTRAKVITDYSDKGPLVTK